MAPCPDRFWDTASSLGVNQGSVKLIAVSFFIFYNPGVEEYVKLLLPLYNFMKWHLSSGQLYIYPYKLICFSGV
jgi:hypothetical protein